MEGKKASTTWYRSCSEATCLALKRKDWTAEGFEGVIWSDECTVEKGKIASTVWVFRSAGEEYLPECVVPHGKVCSNASIIKYLINIKSRTWYYRHCFWAPHHGGFTALLEGRNNAKASKKILKNHLFRVREEMYVSKGNFRPSLPTW